MTKNVVITGGTTGIGASTVERLRAQDCVITNLDIAPSNARGVTTIECDLGDPASIASAVSRLPARIDSLVNVAGVAPGKIPDETVVAINFLGLRDLVEGAIDHVVDGGNIVIVASSAGRDWHSRLDQVKAMLATPDFAEGLIWFQQNKGALEVDAYKFSKQCAAAYTYRATRLAHERRVRVNCVNPGITETRLSPQFRELVGHTRYDAIVDQSGRAGKPADVAGIIEFLAIGNCSWLNGVEITVDGGYYAGALADLLASP